MDKERKRETLKSAKNLVPKKEVKTKRKTN